MGLIWCYLVSRKASSVQAQNNGQNQSEPAPEGKVVPTESAVSVEPEASIPAGLPVENGKDPV